MDVRDRGNIPGAASQRAGLESVTITKEVGDNLFYDFVWEAAGRFVRNVHFRRCVAE